MRSSGAAARRSNKGGARRRPADGAHCNGLQSALDSPQPWPRRQTAVAPVDHQPLHWQSTHSTTLPLRFMPQMLDAERKSIRTTIELQVGAPVLVGVPDLLCLQPPAGRRVAWQMWHAHPSLAAATPASLPKPLLPVAALQAQADSSGVLMDAEAEGFNLADLEGSQDARPGPTAGRHTKRRR